MAKAPKKTSVAVEQLSPISYGPKRVQIEEAKNGFVIELCDADGKQIEIAKNLATSGPILARMFGLKGKKSGRQLKDMAKVKVG